MAETVKVEQDEQRYWELGTAFTQVFVMELNDALKQGSVDDAEKRQQICSRVAFGMGNFLDQYWMEVEGRKYYPLLCFAEQFLDIGVAAEEVEPLHLPAKEFEFHGAADDVTIEFFRRQGEQLERVRIGVIGEE